jgi:hypothetical protein
MRISIEVVVPHLKRSSQTMTETSGSDSKCRGSNPPAPASQSGLHRVKCEDRSKRRGHLSRAHEWLPERAHRNIHPSQPLFTQSTFAASVALFYGPTPPPAKSALISTSRWHVYRGEYKQESRNQTDQGPRDI